MKDFFSQTKNRGKSVLELRTMDAPGWLTGKLLVATPGMPDPRFARTVIYLCSHGPRGAMGLVVNRLFGDADFSMLLDQLNIEGSLGAFDVPVQFGGPVEMGRGFVLHSCDYLREETTRIDDNIAVTATVEIIKDMANGEGPAKSALVLGYAGWGEGQLEEELKNNGWLTVDADEDILFGKDLDAKWGWSLEKIGISPAMLSQTQGYA